MPFSLLSSDSVHFARTMLATLASYTLDKITLHSLFDVTLRLIFSGKFVCRYALIRDVTLNYFEKYSDVTLITVKKIYKCVTDFTLLTVKKIYHFLDL